VGFFEIRDGTFDLLDEGDYALSPTAACLLWFLLACTFHDPMHKLYGHVNPSMCSTRALCKATRRSPAAVRKAMGELESLGFLKRTPQFGYNGFQRENMIKMTAPDDFCWVYRRRGHPKDAACLADCFKDTSN